MGLKIGQLKADPVKELEGVWCEFDVVHGVRFLIASWSNKKFESWRQKALQPYRRKIATGSLEREVDDRLTQEGMSRFILLGWEGLDEDDGTPMVYSPERAYQVLRDTPEVYDYVRMQACDYANYRTQSLEQDQKNSLPASAGSSSGGEA